MKWDEFYSLLEGYFFLKSLPAKCHHDKIQKHKCHYNECPPCSLKCDKLMDCSHNCQSKCHSAVLTEVVENVKNLRIISRRIYFILKIL